ncbi:MAG: YARHG domain-containing protein [Myxococcota bacterium]
MRLLSTGLVLFTLGACNRGQPEQKAGPTVVPGTAPVSDAVAPSIAGRLPVGLPELPSALPDPEPAPRPAEPSTGCDPCSLLLEHELDALKNGKACELCGASDPTVCEGWPEPGTVPCESYDYLRNCIYARLGYDFNTAEEWRVRFEQEPWYSPDPSFRWERVNEVQKLNAKTLRELVSARRCAR